MLSKPKLSVLRRLASEGVVREGLHLAVNGLVDDGFVNKDDGFMLSEKGAAVLYLYDKVTDTERGLLMRMYRAHCEGREFSVDEDVDLVAGDLMLKNLVNGKNANIWLAAYALEAWSGWAEFLNERQKYNEQQKRYQAKKAQKNGAAPIEEESTVQKMHIAHADKPEAAVPPPLETAAECADNCADCVHREVLDLIATKYPKVAALRDTMLAQRKLIEDLGL